MPKWPVWGWPAAGPYEGHRSSAFVGLRGAETDGRGVVRGMWWQMEVSAPGYGDGYPQHTFIRTHLAEPCEG